MPRAQVDDGAEPHYLGYKLLTSVITNHFNAALRERKLRGRMYAHNVIETSKNMGKMVQLQKQSRQIRSAVAALRVQYPIV